MMHACAQFMSLGARRPPPTELPGSDAVKTAPVKTTFQLSRKDGVNIILNLCAAGTEVFWTRA